jgi:hypothetical protein
LRSGPIEATEVAGKADEALQRLHALPTLARLEEEQGPMALTALNSWVVGRLSAAAGSEPLDAVSAKPVEVKPPDAGRK